MLNTIIAIDKLGWIGPAVLWRTLSPHSFPGLTALHLNGQWLNGGKLQCHHCGTEQDKGELPFTLKTKRSEEVKRRREGKMEDRLFAGVGYILECLSSFPGLHLQF